MSRIIAPDGTFDYYDLDRAARRVASALLDGRDDLAEARVAFLAEPGFRHLAIARGIWRAGGIAVPLAISHPPAELDYVIRDSDAAVAIATGSLAERLAPLALAAGAQFILADDLRLDQTLRQHAGDPAGALTAAQPPNRRAMIVYTSGTTARPKGVVTTHGNVAAQIQSLVTAWEWTPRDRTLLVLPLHHVHGIINVVGCALGVGATLEILDHFDAEATWSRLASGEISVFTAVPTVYQRLIRAWDAAVPADRERMSAGCRGMRLMMSGSAALPVTVLDRWRVITGHTLLERYGMTEIGMALANPLHGTRRPGTVGTPLPGVEVKIVDEAGQDVGAGRPGELEIRGPGVFLEYWKRPAESQQAFRNGWFRTGDVAVVEEGYYRLLGRTSTDIIKSGGFKVSALEIEEVVREHPSVADCAVIGAPDAEWGERVCVAVETRPGVSISLDELEHWTKSRLAPYKVPKNLCCVQALPRNAMGKVVKSEVVKLFE
jgi:malonyl-CoA/methylmalonyl-CoA synthetase